MLPSHSVSDRSQSYENKGKIARLAANTKLNTTQWHGTFHKCNQGPTAQAHARHCVSLEACAWRRGGPMPASINNLLLLLAWGHCYV